MSKEQTVTNIESSGSASWAQEVEHELQVSPTHHLEDAEPSARLHQDTSGISDESPDSFSEMPDEELLYDLADLFKVFADTTRIKILYSLMAGELSVNEIAEIVGATQSAVSHQLRTLKQAHLVKFHRDGKSMKYSLSDDHVYTMLAQGMNHICE